MGAYWRLQLLKAGLKVFIGGRDCLEMGLKVLTGGSDVQKGCP